MKEWIPVIGLVLAVLLVLAYKWLNSAPEGYEDESGFHVGSHPLNKPSKREDCGCGGGHDCPVVNKPSKGEKV